MRVLTAFILVAVLQCVDPAGATSGDSVIETSAGGSVTVDGGFVTVGSVSIPRTGHTRITGKDPIDCKFYAIDSTGSDPNQLGKGPEITDLIPGTPLLRECYYTTTGHIAEPITLIIYPTPNTPDAHTQALAQALSQLTIEIPTPQNSPQQPIPVQMETFFWDTNPTTQTTQATANGVTATLTAQHTTTTYQLGDITTLTCPEPTPPYNPTQHVRNQPSTCHTHFNTNTTTLTTNTTSTWHLTWTATNGQTGDLGNIQRTTTTPLHIQEYETVIRNQ